MLSTILVIVFILLLTDVLPSRSHSRGWGYEPTDSLGLTIVVVVILVLPGYIWRPVQPPCTRGFEHRLTGRRELAVYRNGTDAL